MHTHMHFLQLNKEQSRIHKKLTRSLLTDDEVYQSGIESGMRLSSVYFVIILIENHANELYI